VKGAFNMIRKNYPIISVFVDEVHSLTKENQQGKEEVITDTTLKISSYPRISSTTVEKSLNFSHELIKYFTANLLLHHHQDDVPVFTAHLGIREEEITVNTHGGYYSKFIQSIPALQNLLDELLILIRNDLNLQKNNIENIVMDLETIPRLDVKHIYNDDAVKKYIEEEDLDWSLKRIIRTSSSELYALYLNNESAGEVHLHIGKDINSTIVTTIDISDKEKAQLMGFVHEELLETLEEELDTNSTMSFFSEAVEDI
jgi:hypothetical protein